eukprot:9489078-Alexandrium_andersonii.AAC.1
MLSVASLEVDGADDLLEPSFGDDEDLECGAEDLEGEGLAGATPRKRQRGRPKAAGKATPDKEAAKPGKRGRRSCPGTPAASDTDQKKCTSCGITKAKTEYYQLQGRCMECSNHIRSLLRIAKTQNCRDVIEDMQNSDAT